MGRTRAQASRALTTHTLAAMLIAMPQAAAAQSSPTTVEARARPAAPQWPLDCTEPALGRDWLSLTCAIDATTPRQVHIKEHFIGSHDDTTASMEVTIGGTPVACQAGSKTHTEGEDGDVTLECRFTVTLDAGALRASATWFHAQYVGVEVQAPRQADLR